MLTLETIIERAKGSMRGVVAVAAADDRNVLSAIVEAKRLGVARALLFGDGTKIAETLRELGEDPSDYDIRHDGGDGVALAHLAVASIRTGEANILMKGLINTSDMMRAVIDKETGIRTGDLISHVMFYQPPHHKLLALTDGGMITFPDLEKKAGILENAAKTLRSLGYERIYAACVCGSEVVNPKIVATTDAVALSGMTDRWSPYNMSVYGPVGLDMAVSPEACRHKGYNVEGAGEADILLVPTYEVGNGIGKALSLFGGALNAGIVVGAKAPIVLVSRADSAEAKLAAIALSAVTV